MDNIICARAIHPGELLKEEIEYRGISKSKLAEQIGIPFPILNNILNERLTLTNKLAKVFELTLGVSSELLMRMQENYTMRIEKESFVSSHG